MYAINKRYRLCVWCMCRNFYVEKETHFLRWVWSFFCLLSLYFSCLFYDGLQCNVFLFGLINWNYIYFISYFYDLKKGRRLLYFLKYEKSHIFRILSETCLFANILIMECGLKLVVLSKCWIVFLLLFNKADLHRAAHYIIIKCAEA